MVAILRQHKELAARMIAKQPHCVAIWLTALLLRCLQCPPSVVAFILLLLSAHANSLSGPDKVSLLAVYTIHKLIAAQQGKRNIEPC